MQLIKLLVEHGADVNRLYDLYGDKDNQFTALDWAKDSPDIADYLRAHGAKTSAELKESKQESAPAKITAQSIDPSAATAKDVIGYFCQHFGAVDERTLIEIVPSDNSVAIHAIRPAGDRKYLTLFTTGLSVRPMKVPAGQEAYSLAELFIQLPSDWSYTNLKNPNWRWPVVWLRKIAQYPHARATWLGGPFSIIANDDPPKPLAPNTKFTSLLLLAEKSFQRSDGRTVQLYRITPIYSDERDLELSEGAPALMRAFDRKSVPFVVDLNRPSVAK